MALVSLCDNCSGDWVVDSLVWIEPVQKLLCPECINHLVDLLLLEVPESVASKVLNELEEF